MDGWMDTPQTVMTTRAPAVLTNILLQNALNVNNAAQVYNLKATGMQACQRRSTHHPGCGWPGEKMIYGCLL